MVSSMEPSGDFLLFSVTIVVGKQLIYFLSGTVCSSDYVKQAQLSMKKIRVRSNL